MTSLALVLFASAVCTQAAGSCYWNAECPYLLHSTKTPYDTIRGDIRDYPAPQNCEAVSVWTLIRHGNRNPGNRVIKRIKYIASLKDEIVESHEAGRGQLCAQDVENFRKWTWNTTLEVTETFLTGTGYKELFGIGKRIRDKYRYLLQGADNEYYFRPTHEQRTITSGIAFLHGLTEQTNLTVTLDEAKTRDDVIKPYEYCDRFQKTVISSQLQDNELEAYYKTPEFIVVRNAVQQRLGINTTLTPGDIYSIYEICRYERSWTAVLQSPWCAAFSNEDLLVLEYRDDVRFFYRNGYGSWVSPKLGGPALKDLYENFLDSVNGHGKKIISYFTHTTMLEMVYCALGLFKDPEMLGSYRDPNRLWKTSFIGAFSSNFIAVLNRCEVSGNQSYRVQLFVNEKETELCPIAGCTWQQFQDKFQGFTSADLEFCSMKYRVPEPESDGNKAIMIAGFFWILSIEIGILKLCS